MKKTIPLIIGLIFILVACKNQSSITEEYKLPVSQQKALEIIEPIEGEVLQTYEGEVGYESFTLPEYEKLISMDKYSHLKGDTEGYYINVLKKSYGKNLLFQEVFQLDTKVEEELTEKVKNLTPLYPSDVEIGLNKTEIGSLIPDEKKPTLFIFSRTNCPFCEKMTAELLENYKPEDFNLVYGQGHITAEGNIPKDVNLYLIKAQDYKENILKGRNVFGTDQLMEDLGVWYYPTLLYLDEKGYIFNVSQGLSYEEILKVFKVTFPESF